MENIIAAVDFSDITDAVIETAVGFAEKYESVLWVIHVAEPDPDFVGYEAGPDEVREQVAEDFHYQHRELQEKVRALREEGLDAHALLIQGPISEKILEEAEKLDAEMIVIGSHGHGAVYHVLLGSVSEGVIKDARCPVLIVPTV